jgi:choline dehydrogenase-like flavoprotein
MATDKHYDAIVIGSGATGGFAAKELTQRGLEVLVLEAGPQLDEELFHQGGSFAAIGSWPRIKAALKGQHIQARASFFAAEKSFLFVNDLENPYTYPKDDFYLWIRSRNVGGRFLNWGRVALRMSDYDFKAASHDGIGEDWPIHYEELVPYYEQVEDFLGIIGTKDGIANLPDGKYVAEAGLSSYEQSFKDTVESRWPERKVVPWRYVRKEATPPDATGEKRTTAPLAAAEATGRLTLRPNSIVTRIETDSATGRATGVTYIDRKSKDVATASSNVVVVCASTIESIRILLNSRSTKHPDGLGNSSGLVGRYFMDQCPSLVFGSVPDSNGWELVDGTGPADNHGGIYIPRFQNLDEVTHPGFKRGFNIQGMIGRGFVPEGMPALFGFMGQGEMLPYESNRVSLDTRKKDAWGVPVPHITLRMSDNERNMLRAQIESTKEMVDAAGYSIDFAASMLGLDDPNNLLPNAGWLERFMFRQSFKKSMGLGAAIHECGGARMGSDPAKSVLNAYNQCWDASNVFVTDSACFATNGTCGPTLTTMALTTRACEFIANEYQGSPELSSAA